MVDKPDNKDSGRDPRGRFGPGNSGGPGGSRQKSIALRRAAEAAITPELVTALLRKAARMGLEHGDLAAMRIVLERAIGRVAPSPAEPEPLGFTLPPLKTAKDCAEASQRILDAAVQGLLSAPMAQALNDLLNTRLRSIEMVEFGDRLDGLERAAQRVARQ